VKGAAVTRFVCLFRVFVSLVLTLAEPDAAFAQSDREKCAAIAGPMMEASDSVSGMVGAMLRIDYSQVARQFGGDEAAQFRRLEAKQKALMPHMEAFLAELEATAMAMRSCSR